MGTCPEHVWDVSCQPLGCLFLEQLCIKTTSHPREAGCRCDRGSSRRCSSSEVLVKGAMLGLSAKVPVPCGTASDLVPSAYVSARKRECPVGGCCFWHPEKLL